MSRKLDVENLSEMLRETHEYFNMVQDGGVLVHRVEDVFVLFEIPIYGGEPRYIQTFSYYQKAELVKMVETWT